ncbi:NACHT, LRR and PYD domains-containing protein 10-like [Hyalella azteca]|uniref:NACHT, LRR and PYD domains-containing protein 10-like n=1 Tax=Hyalella azteca TaxID=294128 RepID=A0A8B7NZC8_HYAAZ|nr:NACHT, LRR and PYD domains-containing protein 10-like [Hyalella azteca]
MSGKSAVKCLWTIKLSKETLPLDNSIVQRREVFHALDMMVREGPNGQVLSYPEIFKVPEKAIIVSGVAGAGKTTLLKNIVLQFFELQEGNANYLRQFDQLILFECRDRTTETLADVIEQHFKDMCRELEGKRNVLDALLRLDALFVIDGYDEINKVSTNVVREIIKETSSSNCRVLITTRPHSAKEKLKMLLATNDVISTEFEIKPITELVEQLEFLKRYEKSLGIKEGEMAENFAELNEDVRILFTEPINLILFCDIHKHMPETISSWEKPGDVAIDILRLYQKLVTIKLADVTNLECEVILNDLFVVIGKAALEFIRENTVTFSEEELLQVKENCIPILNNKVECSSEIVLSVVLKINRPLSGIGKITYTFHHKTIQEMFAAKFIVQRILKGDSLKSILEAEPEEMSSLREVLQYVVQGLSRCKPRLLNRRWPELKKALRDAGVVSAADWQECLRICPDVEQVAKLAALTKLRENKTWHVGTGREVSAVAAMLPHAQPRVLEVEIKPDDPSKARWAELVERRVGPVHLVLQNPDGDKYKSNDDLLLPMLGTRYEHSHTRSTLNKLKF